MNPCPLCGAAPVDGDRHTSTCACGHTYDRHAAAADAWADREARQRRARRAGRRGRFLARVARRAWRAAGAYAVLVAAGRGA